MAVIGTCSNCGGAVTVPEFWGGEAPPMPTCSRCGARARNAYGRTIDMEKPTDFRDFPGESQQEYFGINKKKDGAG